MDNVKLGVLKAVSIESERKMITRYYQILFLIDFLFQIFLYPR